MKNSRIDQIADFYKQKKVLLTGNTGFKGTWMNLLLNAFGANVYGYSLPVQNGSFFSRVKPEMEKQYEADIADSNRVYQIINDISPDIIIHLASHSSLRGSMEIPHYILQTNLMGVLNILDASKQNDSVKSIVIVTSDKCYKEDHNIIEYTEDSPLGATDPYGTSKVCQELITMCYKDTFYEHTGIASARASNCIGPGDDNETRLIPHLLKTFTEGKIPEIRNPQSVRSWQYVLDVDMGYLLLAKMLLDNPDLSGAYNFGPDKDGFVTVGSLVKKMADAFGLDADSSIPFLSHDQIKKEAMILRLNSQKSETVLGWQRLVSFDEAVKLTSDYSIMCNDTQSECFIAREYVKNYLG